MRRSFASRSPGVAVLAVATLVCVGCFPYRDRVLVGPSGAMHTGPDPDVSFLKPGVTTLDDVLRQPLGSMRVHLPAEAVFLGRWARSM